MVPTSDKSCSYGMALDDLAPDADHALIEMWLSSHPGEGPVWRREDRECYVCSAQDALGGRPLVLEITRAAFDYEGAKIITAWLERLRVADQLKARPWAVLRYDGAGQIALSPNQPDA